MPYSSSVNDPDRQDDDLSSRILRSLKRVPNGTILSKPIVWLSQLIQYLVALIIIALGKSLKYTFRSRKPNKQRRHKPRPTAQELVAERQYAHKTTKVS